MVGMTGLVVVIVLTIVAGLAIVAAVETLLGELCLHVYEVTR